MPEERIATEIDGRTLSLSNLDKPLYPSGFTKGEVIQHYLAVADAMLGHLRGRPLTLRRWPDGTGSAGFYEKNVARTAPDWVPRLNLETSKGTLRTIAVQERATLVWIGNLAGLELHVPQWRHDEASPDICPDRLVVDLDPGPGAGLVQCSQAALLCRDLVESDGLELLPKTSGSKGLQLYAGLDATTGWREVHAYARDLAQALEKTAPSLVVSRMDKQVRRERVLLDWSQNHIAKTTIAPYSLRGRDRPSVSTPLTWSEVEGVALGETDPAEITFEARDLPPRLAAVGDLLAGLEEASATLRRRP